MIAFSKALASLSISCQRDTTCQLEICAAKQARFGVLSESSQIKLRQTYHHLVLILHVLESDLPNLRVLFLLFVKDPVSEQLQDEDGVIC